MPIRKFSEKWNFPELKPVPGLFQVAIGGSTLISKTLYQRGLTTLESALAFLDPKLYSPASPAELPGLVQAADRLQAAVRDNQRILVWGDFDVDGQTSTTVFVSGLRALGATITHYIPVRATESHGISLPSLRTRIAEFQPDLLLTCDTGIDAIEPVAYARSHNLDVIITDHHQLPSQLPDANAVVNPNLFSSNHPLSALPGVGVAYKVIEELFLRQNLDPAFLLDLVALGIVADVAEQIGDTRYLLQRGLEILRANSRPGLNELYKLSGVNPEEITEDTIGYVIGPRLNALGRLDDANPAVEFLTTQDPVRAIQLAEYLDKLNQRRQDLTEEIYNDALDMIEKSPGLVEDYPVLVLAGPPSWDPGVIGIVASRLVDRFHKPTIMLSKDSNSYRGSARSIPGVHITNLISESSLYLNSFGGHPLAAGMSLPADKVASFRASLADNFYRLFGSLPEKIQVNIDSELAFSQISLDFVAEIQRLAPFGAGNPKLLFATRRTTLIADKSIGKNGKHRKLSLAGNDGANLDLLWWNSADRPLPDEPLDVAYSLDQTTFRDQPQIQATVQHVRHSPDAPVYLKRKSKPVFVDLRKSSVPLRDLKRVMASDDALIWAESAYPPGFESCKRSELENHSALVIWTSPPSRLVLNNAIDLVSPGKIILFAIDPSFSSLEEFLQGLLGLIKHMKNTGKKFSVTKFAQALAVPEDVIEVGLEWLDLHGDIDLSELSSTSEYPKGSGNLQPEFPKVDLRLKLMLQEIAAFRAYYHSAPPESFL